MHFFYSKQQTGESQGEHKKGADEEGAESENPPSNFDHDNTEDPPVQKSDAERDLQTPSVSAENEFLQTDHDLLQEGLDELDDLFTLYEDGEIEIEEEDSLNVYTEMMLYLIVTRYAVEVGLRDTAIVNGQELMRELGRSKGEVGAFLNKAGDYTTSPYHWDHSAYNDLDKWEFQVNIKQIPEAVKWIHGEETGESLYQDLYVGTAQSCLSNATEYCKQAKNSRNISDVSGSPVFEIMDAVRDISDYPVAISDDSQWNDFVRSADTAIGYIEDSDYGSARHCIERMERNLEGIATNIEELSN